MLRCIIHYQNLQFCVEILQIYGSCGGLEERPASSLRGDVEGPR